MFMARNDFMSARPRTPPAFNSYGPGTGRGTSSSATFSASFTHTVAAGNDTVALLFVSAAEASGLSVFGFTSATFGGQNMALINSVTTSQGLFRVYGLPNPPSGVQTVAFAGTRSGSAGAYGFVSNTLVFSNSNSWADSGSTSGVGGTPSITTGVIPSTSAVAAAACGLELQVMNALNGGVFYNPVTSNINDLFIRSAAGSGSTLAFTGQSPATAGSAWGGLWVQVNGI